MQIEIVKFYETSRENEKQYLVGTLHIRFPAIGLNVKGITVFRKKKYWHFRLPSRRAYDQVLGKEVDYACVLFDEREKNETLISFLQTEGRKFVEDYINSSPEVAKIEIVPEPAKSADQGEASNVQQKSKEGHLKPAEAKPPTQLPKSTAKFKEFITPPPRKHAFTRTNSKSKW